MTIHAAAVWRRSWNRKPGRDLRPLERQGERRADLAPGPLIALREQHGVVHGAVDRHAAGLTALGLVERDRRRRDVDAFPLEPEDLRLAHAGVDRDRDDREQVAVARLAARG